MDGITLGGCSHSNNSPRITFPPHTHTNAGRRRTRRAPDRAAARAASQHGRARTGALLVLHLGGPQNGRRGTEPGRGYCVYYNCVCMWMCEWILCRRFAGGVYTRIPRAQRPLTSRLMCRRISRVHHRRHSTQPTPNPTQTRNTTEGGRGGGDGAGGGRQRQQEEGQGGHAQGGGTCVNERRFVCLLMHVCVRVYRPARAGTRSPRHDVFIYFNQRLHRRRARTRRRTLGTQAATRARQARRPPPRLRRRRRAPRARCVGYDF